MKNTTPTKGELRAALERLCKELGEMPHDWPSNTLFRAYCEASNLLDPDEFTERFMGQSTPKSDTSAEHERAGNTLLND